MSTPIRRSHRETRAKGKAKQNSASGYGEENGEDPLEELTRPQLLQINRVFDAMSAKSRHRRPTHKVAPQDKAPPGLEPIPSRQESPQDAQAGGFIVEDQNPLEGGGFLVEDESREEPLEPGGFLDEEDGADVPAGGFFPEETGGDVDLDESIDHGKRKSSGDRAHSPSSRKASNYISIRQIPDALRMLSLPYRSREIIEIFENAASSDDDDQSDRHARPIQRHKEKVISRGKFSKVCAVLMVADGDSHDPESEADGGTGRPADRRRRKRVEEDEDYGVDQGSSDEASSASDYQPDRLQDDASARSRSTRRGHQARQPQPAAASPPDTALSKGRSKRRQATGKKPTSSEAEDGEDESMMQNSARDTFALFLQPPPMNADLSNRTIGFEEIRRAADQLGEAMSDEEVLEMLNYASYSNNSRVTLHAFEKLIQEIRTV